MRTFFIPRPEQASGAKEAATTGVGITPDYRKLPEHLLAEPNFAGLSGVPKVKGKFRSDATGPFTIEMFPEVKPDYALRSIWRRSWSASSLHNTTGCLPLAR